MSNDQDGASIELLEDRRRRRKEKQICIEIGNELRIGILTQHKQRQRRRAREEVLHTAAIALRVRQCIVSCFKLTHRNWPNSFGRQLDKSSVRKIVEAQHPQCELTLHVCDE